MATQAQVRRLRSALRDVDTVASRALLAQWRTYNLTDAVAATRALLVDLPVLTAEFSGLAATIAADWYEDVRGDSFATTTADPPPLERVEALARWGAGPLWGAADTALALSLISGGYQRIVANGARDTIIANANRDPAKPRVARHASADACAFCAMLATRGPVYSLDTGDFEAHDKCGCVAVPVFDEYEEPAYVGQWRDAYKQSRAGTGGKTSEILSNMRQVIGTN